ncbi:MAG: hypothetical protein GX905_05845 [Bacteroidales bacterium]|nr:hypothetical protein [Bacteroidales bacterium]
MDFREGSKEAIDYFYDENGNLKKDLNKNISEIAYNLLNLPKQITFNIENIKNKYLYAADGRKLKVTHQKGASSKVTDYVGNMIYEDNTLKRILVDGGYIEEEKYHFYVQDLEGYRFESSKSLFRIKSLH